MSGSENDPVLNLLREGRARIVRGWTKGSFARNRSGRLVLSWHVDAKKWCAMGALNAEGPPFGNVQAALDFLSRVLPRNLGSVDVFNDAPETTKQDVLDLYDRAIALCLKENTNEPDPH